MSGFYSGKEGQLFINGTQVAKVRSWSFTFNQAILETVSLEDTDRTIIPGIRSFTGNASIYYYQNNVGGGSGALSTLINDIIKNDISAGGSVNSESSTNLTFKLNIKDGSQDGRFIEFAAQPTSMTMTNSVGEVLAADINFEVNGAPTRLNL
tara:strand:+ start:21 stop:476 length:456 start_codon:yes stop_codon:yes gene_type:complete